MLKDLFKYQPGTPDQGYIWGPIAVIIGFGIGIYSVVTKQNNTSLAIGFISAGFTSLAATNYTSKPGGGAPA